MTEPIPGPPGLPLLGNINDIDPADSMASLLRLADTYGKLILTPMIHVLNCQVPSTNSRSEVARKSSYPLMH